MSNRASRAVLAFSLVFLAACGGGDTAAPGDVAGDAAGVDAVGGSDVGAPSDAARDGGRDGSADSAPRPDALVDGSGGDVPGDTGRDASVDVPAPVDASADVPAPADASVDIPAPADVVDDTVGGFRVSVASVPTVHGVANVAFTLSDSEGRPADVELYYRVGTAGWRRASTWGGAPADGAGLETSPSGTDHVLAWTTVHDLGKGAWQDVRVRVVVRAPVSAAGDSPPFAVANAVRLVAVESLAGGACHDAVAIDGDGEGALDLALACVPRARLALAGPNGTYADAPAGWLPAVEGEIFGVATGDLVGDDSADLVFAVGSVAEAPARNRVLQGKGTVGGFFDVTDDVFPDVLDQSEYVAAVDIDGDDDLDLWVVNSGSQQDRLYRNDAGVFVEITETGLPADEWMGADGAVADLDGDTRPDLVVVNFVTSHGIHLLQNTGGAFADRTAAWLPLGQPQGMLLGLAIVDADGDDAPDVYLADALNQDQLLLNDGTGVLRPGGALPDGLGIGSLHAAALDVDLDGDQDLFLSRTGTTDRLLLGDGAGRFTLAPGAVFTEDDATESRNVIAADLDRDGDPDVVVLGEGVGVRVWWNREAE